MGSTFTRTLMLLLVTGLGTWYCVAQAQLPAKAAKPVPLDVKDKELVELAFQRAKLLKVTKEPQQVFDRSMTACRPNPSAEERRNAPENPHQDSSVLVYLTNHGRDIMATGKGTYPVGAVILKEKLHLAAGANPPAANQPPNAYNTKASASPRDTTELFTGMLKREAGYNPPGGDWEYFVVSGDARKLLARGKIDSCIDCHEPYKATDYVTRAYMPREK